MRQKNYIIICMIYEANYQILKPPNFFVTVFSNLMAYMT